MVFSQPFLVLISIGYICLLFLIAWIGDRTPKAYRSHATQAHVYSLSLAVYFTAWTFYGAVGRAATEGLSYLSIYVGPLLMFVFGIPILRRILLISKRQNITSIADFIATRYGKSQRLAALITLMAVIGSVPYIALQLKAISMGFGVLTDDPGQATAMRYVWNDTAWYIALLLALFAILFGTRHLESTEHHRGMIQSVAFESLVKLISFLAIGCFALWLLFHAAQASTSPWQALSAITSTPISISAFIMQSLMSFFAIICLPRQFHVTVVENQSAADLETARWVMPLYLLIASAFVVPIAAAGMGHMNQLGFSPDILLLALPMLEGQNLLAVLGFLGGGSAAAAMVIVSSVALATMVSNELVMPAMLRYFRRRLARRDDIGTFILLVRRTTILVLLLVAYAFYQAVESSYSLTAFGLLSFAAVAQFGPALLGGIYWRHGNQYGAFWGLLVGFALWFYTLLLPTLGRTQWIDLNWIEHGIFGWAWTRPEALFGVVFDPLSHGFLWSFGVNLCLYVFISLLTRQPVTERFQVATYFQEPTPRETEDELALSGVTVGDLFAVVDRFLGKERGRSVFRHFEQRWLTTLQPGRNADPALIRHVERQLSSVIGSSTTRVVMESTLSGRGLKIEDLFTILDEATQTLTFNRELLQAAIENLSLGVSVVDSQQRIVAWNQRYLELFKYPDGLVTIGRPVAELVRHNLTAAHLPAERIEETIERRLGMMREGVAHEYERIRPDGTILLISGNPMPGGGFVTTFQDVSQARKTQQALKETNTYLEQRVRERTNELQHLNQQLLNAKSAAESANQGKTRFLASASHDLLQPMNAARLFTSALSGHALASESRELLTHIDSSLTAAEEILVTLLDISKMDAGALEPEFSRFPVNDLLLSLNNDFSAMATQRGLTLKTLPCSAWVVSDSKLLRRVLQNLLSNAIRYTNRGRVILGCRRMASALRIEIWDSGSGIPPEQIPYIFEEFRRLPHQHQDQKGLGLGLAIVERVGRVLNHAISVRSWPGQGSVFSITVPTTTATAAALATPATPESKAAELTRVPGSLSGLRVLCIDNEQAVLEGMRALLSGWGCDVVCARTQADAVERLATMVPELVLADYQLDDNVNGLDVADALIQQWGRRIPAVLVTAVADETVKDRAHALGFRVLHKPVKPAALRAMMSQLIMGRHHH